MSDIEVDGSTQQSRCRAGREDRIKQRATQVHSARVDMSMTQDRGKGSEASHRKQGTGQATKPSPELRFILRSVRSPGAFETRLFGGSSL